MIKLKECPICKGIKLTKKLDCTDYSTSKENFKIVSCETCGFLFTNPRPFDKDLKKYYISGKYISHTNEKKGTIRDQYNALT